MLRRCPSGDKCIFLYRYDPNNEAWGAFKTFGAFHIAYGVQIADMEMAGGRLVHKVTGEQLFLVDGPYHSHLQDTYEALSEDLYKTMVDESKMANEGENGAPAY